MKKILLSLLMVFCFSSMAMAGVTTFPTPVQINDQTCIDVPLNTFFQETGHATAVPMAMATGMAVLSASTAPGFEFDNGMTSLVWADGEQSPITTTIKNPYNWTSGIHFRVSHTQSTGAVAAALDFDVRLVKDGTVAPTSVTTNQTAVTLVPSSESPQTATLTPSTDLSSIVPGDKIVFRFWRDDVNTSTEDVEIYKVEMCGSNPAN